MLVKTIEMETNDDTLFSKSAPLLTAASEVAYHTINTSSLNMEELRREGGITVSGMEECCHGVTSVEIIPSNLQELCNYSTTKYLLQSSHDGILYVYVFFMGYYNTSNYISNCTSWKIFHLKTCHYFFLC